MEPLRTITALPAISILTPLLVGLVIGIVLLFKKGGKTGCWIAGGTLLLMLFVGLLILLQPKTVYHREIESLPTAASTDSNSYQELSGNLSDIPPVWMSGLDEQFQADVYPSVRAAVRSLGRQIEKPIRTVLQSEDPPQQILLIKNDSNQEYLDEFARAIEDKMQVSCLITDKAKALNKGEVEIVLSIDKYPDTKPAPWSKHTLSHGNVEARVITSGRSNSIQTKYVEKPWADNFSEFANRYPSHHWILARSQRTCTNYQAAHQQATRHAARQIGLLLKERVPQLKSLNITDSDLQQGKFYLDHFCQSFAGSSGPICRDAVLLDASEEKLTALLDKKLSLRRLAQKSWIYRISSLLGMTVLICLVYAFLNVATRGYYTWALRVAVVVLIAAGVFLVLTLI